MNLKYSFLKKIIITLVLTHIFVFVGKVHGEVVPVVIDYAAGSGFSVIIDDEGDIWSWGSNEYGQLGHGGNEGKSEPTKISLADDGEELPKFSKIDAGYGLTLALDVEGNMWSFGYRGGGQLGIGKTNTNLDKPHKITLSDDGDALPKFKSIKAGYLASFAVEENGDLWAWGNGYPKTPYVFAPKKVQGLSKVIDIEVDSNTYYVLDDSGDLYEWGESINNNGYTYIPSLIKIDGLPDIKRFSAGGDAILILDKQGDLWEIGNNSIEKLVEGDNENEAVELPKFEFVCKGRNYSSAIDVDGNIWSWGRSKNYETGLSTTEEVKKPTKTTSLDTHTKFISLATSVDISKEDANNFIFALDEDKHIWSWGNNEHNVTSIGSHYENVEKPTKLALSQSNFKVSTSDSITLMFDETQEGTQEQSQELTVNPVIKVDKSITGTGKPGSNIEVIFSNYEVSTTSVDENGEWKAVVPEEADLAGNISVSQTDGEGNVIQAKAEIKSQSRITNINSELLGKEVKPDEGKLVDIVDEEP